VAEALVDLVCPGYHPAAKVIKDVTAAAVLLSAITALAIGLLVLGPPLVARLWGSP
jgi:diacylglycerol kinase